MKAVPAFPLTRRFVVVVMLLSWLVLTNHCALATILPSPVSQSEHAHCHAMMHHGAKELPSRGMRECCQAVKASVPVKTAVKFDASRFVLQPYPITAVIALSIEEPAAGLLRDHGPPSARSFAEIVLQRSLLSHAPPFRA